MVRVATSLEMVYKWPPRDLLSIKGNYLYRRSSLLGIFRLMPSWADFRQAARISSAHIPAGLDPFVVRLGQHRADQADDGVTAGEDADHVGAVADLLVQPLLYPALVVRASR